MNARLQFAIPPSRPAIEVEVTEGQRRVVSNQPDRDTIVIPRTACDLSAFPGIASTGVSLGSVLFVPAGTCTSIGFGDGHSAIVVTACPSLRRNVHLRLNQAQGVVPATAVMLHGHRQIGAILSMIGRVAAEETAQPDDELHLLVELLLWRLARAAAAGPSAPSVRQPRLDQRNIERIDRFIDDNLETGLRLRQLAELVGMSSHHFLRCFKRMTGLSPLQYVLARRVDRAQVLLATGQGSIAEIAYATGFSSQSHLNAMFKRHLGVTPGAYRRQVAAAPRADREGGERSGAGVRSR